MFCVPSISGLFKWRQFGPEVILLAVGWYLRFSLSYRDVEELLAERGLHADHVTVWRWVQRYAPEMERRLRSRLRPTNDSWRVDETYIRVKGKWVYLYRAVDSSGATITTKTQQQDEGFGSCALDRAVVGMPRSQQACGSTVRTVFQLGSISPSARGRKKVTWCLLIRRRCLFSRWQKLGDTSGQAIVPPAAAL